jgi:hypothetical protein
VNKNNGLGFGNNCTADDSNHGSFLSEANPISGWRGSSPGFIYFSAQEDECKTKIVLSPFL